MHDITGCVVGEKNYNSRVFYCKKMKMREGRNLFMVTWMKRVFVLMPVSFSSDD